MAVVNICVGYSCVLSSKTLQVVISAARSLSTAVSTTDTSCRLLVVGGGSGGCSVAAKFASKLGKNNVIVVEPSDRHYYQPMFTLIGGGMKKLEDSFRPMGEVLPKQAQWIKDSVTKIEGHSNYAVTAQGTKINYDYIVVASGLVLDYGQIPGLAEALSDPRSGVCSNYSPMYVQKTYDSLERFQEGNLVFTFPNTPVKCAGAPQKIAYIADHYLRKVGKREKAKVVYNTSLGVLFGCKKYADSLWEVCKARDIQVNLRTNLVAVDHVTKTAKFQNLDNPDQPLQNVNFSLLHVTPPMAPPPYLRSSPLLTDPSGWLDVDKQTLRHKSFRNMFGIGDCTNLPTSKTAAAVAAQSGVLYDNLLLAMKEQPLLNAYDGYTSCPLVTGYDRCILAEFDYQGQPLETFPVDQSKESRLMFHLKKDAMPILYWNAMLKGYWRGPGTIRRVLRGELMRRSVGIPS